MVFCLYLTSLSFSLSSRYISRFLCIDIAMCPCFVLYVSLSFSLVRSVLLALSLDLIAIPHALSPSLSGMSIPSRPLSLSLSVHYLSVFVYLSLAHSGFLCAISLRSFSLISAHCLRLARFHIWFRCLCLSLYRALSMALSSLFSLLSSLSLLFSSLLLSDPWEC
jgi:hypothetical protein